jgi:hypothetical protein
MSIIAQTFNQPSLFGTNFDARLERVDANTIQLIGVPYTSKMVFVRDVVFTITSALTLDTDSASEYLVTGTTTVAKGSALSTLTTGYNDYSLLYVYLCNDNPCWSFSAYDRKRQLIISQSAPTTDGYLADSGNGLHARQVGFICLNSSRQMDNDLMIASVFNSPTEVKKLVGTSGWISLTQGVETDCENCSLYMIVPAKWTIIILGTVYAGNNDPDNVAFEPAIRYGGSIVIQPYQNLNSNAGALYHHMLDLEYGTSESSTVVKQVKLTVKLTGANSTPQYHGAGSRITVWRHPSPTPAGFTRQAIAVAPSPDYMPPTILYKSATELYLRRGRYFAAGHRFNGQYADTFNMGFYWDVLSNLSVTITSQFLGGKVNNSWYSVFLKGNTASDIQLLPYIRVNAVSYSSPNTTINPGQHNTYTNADNTFLTSNDLFNTYRLVKQEVDITGGTVLTIADSVDATPDQIIISGDQTGSSGAQLVAGSWLQMIPPDGVPFVYLGTVRVDGSGNLLEFMKMGWLYQFKIAITVNANCSLNYANTEVGSAVPPCAQFALFTLYGANSGTAATFSIVLDLVYGLDGSQWGIGFNYSNSNANDAWRRDSAATRWPMTATTKIRNRLYGWSSTPDPDANLALQEGYFYFYGFEE